MYSWFAIVAQFYQIYKQATSLDPIYCILEEKRADSVATS